MGTNLVTYFTSQLNQHSATASKNVANWGGTCYITPLIGAFVADAYLGRYLTILYFSVVYVIVSIISSIFTWLLFTMVESREEIIRESVKCEK